MVLGKINFFKSRYIDFLAFLNQVHFELYLLSILIKMDSDIKVELMVRTMMNDPNTPDETKKVIAKLLSDTGKEKKESQWFAYLDLKYSQTEQDNMSGITKTKQLLQENNKIPYSEIDSRLVVEYDKSYTRGSGLTFGKNIDNSSSMFFNLGLDINTLNKKIKGDSDIFSGSLSYFKIIDEHYISPYVYYNKPNYRKQEDYETVGVGFNNTWIINEKNNINYGLGISNTEYVINTSEGFETASDNNNDVYSSFIRYNYNNSRT